MLHLKERTTLWNRLPIRLQSKFLAATLDELVEEILADKWSGTVEPILTAKAQSLEFITKFLGQKRSDPTAILRVNAVLNNLTDNYLKDYINNLPTIEGIVAAQLGQLVALRDWKLSAKVILNKANHNSGFKSALNECVNMFSFLDKIIHYQSFGHKPSVDDALNALKEVMIGLYEGGADQDNVWERAGGDVSKLTNSQSRREQWTVATKLLKHGGGGKNISPESLIRTALEDYKSNAGLQSLAALKHLFKS